MVDNKVDEVLRSHGFSVLNSGKHFYSSGSLLTLETWLRKSKFRLKNANQVVVN